MMMKDAVEDEDAEETPGFGPWTWKLNATRGAATPLSTGGKTLSKAKYIPDDIPSRYEAERLQTANNPDFEDGPKDSKGTHKRNVHNACGSDQTSVTRKDELEEKKKVEGKAPESKVGA
ncbi:hypothetical protein GLAREA_02309 [Glarea lozoyensis ATCC 20868]|uniref:Uncharacterized protein n=1 Tax=Glarea lozoyensis (strain ATCC 20868 / MF5171) TaxID=1116229 RepID=S3D2X0_GLAL2|nr:uncharacterized protein GLAREA_02309 [Glarea lozoyensis ATCC 20868]EPE26396.1 hypothetical protein GLAREA_02309 [Glarea lozoyensis ATCC 20868]